MTDTIQREKEIARFREMAKQFPNEVLVNAFGTVWHCWDMWDGFPDEDPEITAYKREILSRMKPEL